MSEVKFDAGNQKAADALFDDENLREYSPLQNFVNDAKMSQLKNEKSFAAEEKSFANYLKQALLFLPGTFLLFYTSLATVFILTDILANPGRDLPISTELFLIYLVGFLAIFMTWFGLGDIKNRKHFVIPASIILAGAAIGAIVRAMDGIFWLAGKIIDDFGYAICLFPIGLIVPILAKGWVDRKAE